MIIKSHENAILLNLNWSTRIKNTLEEIGMYDAYLEQNRNAHITIFQRLVDTFHQNAFSEIGRESSKLRTYHIIKTNIGYEDYLNEIQNIEARVAFTKFRLSNHSLMIEIGRHQRIDKSLRHCPFCSSEIEDELHFLIECKTYKSHRKELIRDLTKKYRNFPYLNKTGKFSILMNDLKITSSTAKCISKMFDVRSYLMRKLKGNI